MQKVLILKNITHEEPGTIAEALTRENIPFDVVDLDQGETIPPFDAYAALVVLGGPDSANDAVPKITDALERIREWLNGGRPYLGVCLGLQLMVKAAGAQVVKSPVQAVGFYDPQNVPYEITLTPEGRRDPLFQGIPETFPVFQLHGETVIPGGGMTLLGTGRHCPNQIVRYAESAYGFQCHFEMTPSMLELWHGKDPWLKALDLEKLRRDWQALENAYCGVSSRLLSNFLKLTYPKVL